MDRSTGPRPRIGPATTGLIAAILLAGCGLFQPPAPTTFAVPEPTCGGAAVEIPGALECQDLADRAIAHLREQAPQQLDRGVISVTVELQGCPANEVPPQLDCTGHQWVQLVTVTFGPSGEGGPIEPSLSVGIEPVTGQVLGVVNPLIR